MAHNLLIENGRASMMYVRETPWHGLGTCLDKPATAEEAIKAANLDWEVEKLPLVAVKGNQQLPVKDRYAVVRSGSPEPLGIVGRDYTLLQNRDAFGFFDSIVDRGEAIFHTAGALGNGEKIWMLAKLPGYIRVANNDISEKFLLLSNSHNGLSSVLVKFTGVRVVCQNTLTMAVLGNEPILRIAHNTDIHQKIAEANRLLGIMNAGFHNMEASFQQMAKIQMDEIRLKEYLERVYPSPEDPKQEAELERVKRDREWSEFFFTEGAGNRMDGVVGSLWAALNGVTEAIDHRQTRQSQDQRLNSIWFGNAGRIKNRAYAVAQDMAESLLN